VDHTRRDDEFRAYVQKRRVELVRTATLLAAGDRHAGEDLVQTTLTRLYLRWPKVREQTRDAYVRRALVNAALDERRRRTRHPAVSLETCPTAELPDRPTHEGPTDQLDEPLRSALAALPARMRAAVVLLHWLDLDPEAAGVLMGCRPGTVKSQASRGVAKLRECLAPHTAPGAPLQKEDSR
jgi:RNA polymerase sigma-70 factor (sigma-E family)